MAGCSLRSAPPAACAASSTGHRAGYGKGCQFVAGHGIVLGSGAALTVEPPFIRLPNLVVIDLRSGPDTSVAV